MKFVQKYGKCEQKQRNIVYNSKNLKPRYLPVKNENKKNLFNSIFYTGRAFLMVPLTTLYDDYIDQQN